MTKYFKTSSFNVFPTHLNYGNTLFGGIILSKIDCEAAKVTKALIFGTECDNCVTASFDRVDFLAPAKQGDLIILEADVVSVGRTSMKISVNVFIWKGNEKEDWVKITTAMTTFVALKDSKPHPHNIIL